jgi:menaquinone-dependent protoporphyrinogen IX oxidase
MKLWQALDPVSARVLLRQEGAQAWLSSFPASTHMEVAHLTAVVLDSEVADEGVTNALQVFIERFTQALLDNASLSATVRSHWAEQGHAPALLSALSPQGKPVLPS